MGYLRGFTPWVVYGLVSSFDWRGGALAGLLTGLFLFIQDRRRGIAADAQILDVSTVVYFAGLVALAFAAPDSPLKPYADVLSFGWLALTAWGSLLIGRPFTLGIARLTTPPEYWDQPEFVRINVVITTVWAGAFTALGISLAVCVLADAPGWVGVAVHVAGLAAPVTFTSLYSARAQARAEALAAAS
ncbi:hypothetical protein GCM10011583_14940 [Streptomyces camponoticapitis]|uniref:DUF3159 domain-containing protein n=1 Tax=Streptomyces camponoticapitis TaxID=1616125 RepID=A0ABQ2E0F0_9ACTN|nr:hypothetical protein [Streptomyces camponoticapitis]GGJ84300.1 hypothetical protein GCM10011583_14940 [Streptomyces camponoticapitis]